MFLNNFLNAQNQGAMNRDGTAIAVRQRCLAIGDLPRARLAAQLRDQFVDLAEAGRALGHEIRVYLREGLEETVRWMRRTYNP